MHRATPLRLGPIMQNGYLVPDIEAAVRHWTEVLGIGPFFLFEHPQFNELWYRGEKCTVDISAAIAYWGDVQIELIQQWNDVPSTYRDSPAASVGGLHHVGAMTQSLAADIERLGERGVEPVQWGEMVGGVRFGYFASDYHPGGILELIEHGPIDAYWTKFRDAARQWDGSEPLRRLT
jgi:glyoxalase/bleomycin resistance protein/dioxygenase superfamily protein